VDDLDLVARCRAGDQAAARKVFERYVEKLLALAQRRISQRLAGRVDREDVVQSVFRTFFHRVREGRFTFEEPDDLAKVLVRITVYKAHKQVARHRAQKRSAGLEVGQGPDTQLCWEELLSPEPSAEAQVAFLDELEGLLGRLQPQEREVLELRLQGYNNEEIAEKLGTYERKVRRVLERVRKLIEQQGVAGAGEPRAG
jgi:RNA polymerase sigma-70 factor (ECF subfamily)